MRIILYTLPPTPIFPQHSLRVNEQHSLNSHFTEPFFIVHFMYNHYEMTNAVVYLNFYLL